MEKLAPTFSEQVETMATESPHATIMDWWRRLDLAIDDYFKGIGRRPAPRSEQEACIASDPQLGSDVADRLRRLV